MSGSAILGSIIGGHRVVRELGGGGMGTVYYAEHVAIGRRAAIKVLHGEVARDPEVVQRFQAEARAANEIRHPNVVEITDIGVHEGLYYIVMEFLEGETLGARLEREGRCPEATAAHITRQVTSALGGAHERGIIHRDLKPENVFLTNHPDYPDFVKVLDFGIAKLLLEDKVEVHTASGVLMGTPTYMSPEQCRGSRVLDHRSDIYSLGVVLYELVTGRPPFLGPALGEIIVQHVTEAPRPPVELAPSLSPQWNAAILRALAKAPEDRFASMRELREAIEPQEAGRPARVTSLGAAGGPGPGSASGATRPGKANSPTAQASVRAAGARLAAAVRATAELVAFEQAGGVARLEQEERERREAEAVSGTIGEIIANRIRNDRLVLPAMPGTALECMQLLGDPDHTFAKIGSLIERDPLLAARIVRLANSAAMATRVPATTVEQAVSRMGSSGVTAALVEFSLHDAFNSRDERIRRAWKGIWEHSLATALLAREICVGGKVDGIDAQAAYMVGLLHDIGKPVVGGLLLEAERHLSAADRVTWMSDAVWRRVIESCHRTVGVALARKWRLPDAVGAAIEQSREYRDKPARSIGNVVCLANAVVKRLGLYDGVVEEDALDGSIRRGAGLLGLEEAQLGPLSGTLVARIAAMLPAGDRGPTTNRLQNAAAKAAGRA